MEKERKEKGNGLEKERNGKGKFIINDFISVRNINQSKA